MPKIRKAANKSKTPVKESHRQLRINRPASAPSGALGLDAISALIDEKLEPLRQALKSAHDDQYTLTTIMFDLQNIVSAMLINDEYAKSSAKRSLRQLLVSLDAALTNAPLLQRYEEVVRDSHRRMYPEGVSEEEETETVHNISRESIQRAFRALRVPNSIFFLDPDSETGEDDTNEDNAEDDDDELIEDLSMMEEEDLTPSPRRSPARRRGSGSPRRRR